MEDDDKLLENWTRTACRSIVISGNFQLVRELYKAGAPIRLCIDDAALNNHFDIVKWLVKKGTPITSTVCAAAATNNNIKMLKWLTNKIFNIKGGSPGYKKFNWDEQIFSGAVENGHLKILEWAKDNKIPLSISTFKPAAYNGDISTLQWVFDKGYCSGDLSSLSAEAARGGHIYTIKFLCKQGHKLCEKDFIGGAKFAGETGDITILEYLINKQCPRNAKVFAAAAYGGNINVLYWLMQHNFPWDKRAIESAIDNNQLVALKWLYKRRVIMEGTLPLVINTSNIDILKWCISKKIFSLSIVSAVTKGDIIAAQLIYDDDKDINKSKILYDIAIQNDDIVMVEWLFNHSFKGDKFICAEAAAVGNLQILQWARSKSLYWDNNVFIKATKSGNLAIIKWAHDNKCEQLKSLCSLAAKYKYLNILKWAYYNRYPTDKDICTYASENNDLIMLKWARKKNFPYDWRVYANAKQHDLQGNSSMLNWILESNQIDTKIVPYEERKFKNIDVDYREIMFVVFLPITAPYFLGRYYYEYH